MAADTTILDPLSAFQLIASAMAAAVAIEAWKSRSWTGGGITLVFAALAIFTQPISAQFPVIGSAFAEIGSSAVSWWIIVVAGVAVWMTRGGKNIRKPDVQDIAGEEQISQRIERTELSLKRIEEEVGFLPALRETLKASFEQIDGKISDLSDALTEIQRQHRVSPFNSDLLDKISQAIKIGEVLHKRIKRDATIELVERLEKCATAHETNFRPGLGRMDTVGREIGTIAFQLSMLGIPMDQTQARFAIIDEKMARDGIYAHLNAEGDERFATIDQKRVWHGRREKLDYLKGQLSHATALLGQNDGDLEAIERIQ